MLILRHTHYFSHGLHEVYDDYHHGWQSVGAFIAASHSKPWCTYKLPNGLVELKSIGGFHDMEPFQIVRVVEAIETDKAEEAV